MTNFEWAIPANGLETNAGDGALRAIHWSLTASDGPAAGTVYGAVMVPEADRARLAGANAVALLAYVRGTMDDARVTRLQNAAQARLAGTSPIARASAA